MITDIPFRIYLQDDGQEVAHIGLPSGEGRRRAIHILKAACLQIEDKAPLFDGPAPVNTNASDIGNYQQEANALVSATLDATDC